MSSTPSTTFATFNQEPSNGPILGEREQLLSWVTVGVLGGMLVLAYLNMFWRIAGGWERPQYSHGWLIPIFAAILLFLRREPFTDVPVWHRWIGVAIILFGFAMRVFGATTVLFSVDNLSFIPCMIGLFVLVGGLPTLRWAGPAILFLVFMYPWPRFAEVLLMNPLQRMAAACSDFALVTLGLDVIREGTRLSVNGHDLNVAEACSGLRMLTIFTALSVAMALISSNRPLWERVFVVLSAIPIAIFVNVVRISVTGLCFAQGLESKELELFVHDATGLAMMPMAIGLLFLENYVLSNLFIEDTADAPPMDLSGGNKT